MHPLGSTSHLSNDFLALHSTCVCVSRGASPGLTEQSSRAVHTGDSAMCMDAAQSRPSTKSRHGCGTTVQAPPRMTSAEGRHPGFFPPSLGWPPHAPRDRRPTRTQAVFGTNCPEKRVEGICLSNEVSMSDLYWSCAHLEKRNP